MFCPRAWGEPREVGRKSGAFPKPLGQENTCIIAKERSGVVQCALRGLTRLPFAGACSAVVAFVWTTCSVLQSQANYCEPKLLLMAAFGILPSTSFAPFIFS